MDEYVEVTIEGAYRWFEEYGWQAEINNGEVEWIIPDGWEAP